MRPLFRVNKEYFPGKATPRIYIGLLPEMDPDKITFIGNSSLLGTKMNALTNRTGRDMVVTKGGIDA